MLKRKNNLKQLGSFLFEVGTLRKIPRGHMQTLLSNDLSDNIASHSYRVAIIGWFLAQSEHADPYKVVTMCLFHDIPEARSGDQNWVHKKYVKVFEDEIASDQINNLTDKDKLKALFGEYKKRESKESIISKDADLLDQILLLKEYIWQGNQEATLWMGGEKGIKGKNTQYMLLKTKTAKKLADEIIKQKPSDWWRNLWTEKRR